MTALLALTGAARAGDGPVAYDDQGRPSTPGDHDGRRGPGGGGGGERPRPSTRPMSAEEWARFETALAEHAPRRLAVLRDLIARAEAAPDAADPDKIAHLRAGFAEPIRPLLDAQHRRRAESAKYHAERLRIEDDVLRLWQDRDPDLDARLRELSARHVELTLAERARRVERARLQLEREASELERDRGQVQQLVDSQFGKFRQMVDWLNHAAPPAATPPAPQPATAAEPVPEVR